jgi:hypothetical protein
MNKDKFIECATLFNNEQRNYFEKIMQVKIEFTKNTQAIEKQFELNIFTEEAMNDERRYLYSDYTNDLVLEYLHDDANIINAVISTFTCEGEDRFNTKFY